MSGRREEIAIVERGFVCCCCFFFFFFCLLRLARRRLPSHFASVVPFGSTRSWQRHTTQSSRMMDPSSPSFLDNAAPASRVHYHCSSFPPEVETKTENLSTKRLAPPRPALSDSLRDISNVRCVRCLPNSPVETPLRNPFVLLCFPWHSPLIPVTLHPINLNSAMDAISDSPLQKVNLSQFSEHAGVDDDHIVRVALNEGTRTHIAYGISTNDMHEEEDVMRKTASCGSAVSYVDSCDRRSTLEMRASETNLNYVYGINVLRNPSSLISTKHDTSRETKGMRSIDTMPNATAGCACNGHIADSGRNMKREADVVSYFCHVYDAGEMAEDILQNVSEQMLLKLESQRFGTVDGPLNLERDGKVGHVKEELENRDLSLAPDNRRLSMISPGVCREDEARIWAELELEIERDLEREIKTKIVMLSKRLEDLHAVQSRRFSSGHLKRDMVPDFKKDRLRNCDLKLIKDEILAKDPLAADPLRPGGNELPLQREKAVKPPSSTARSSVGEPLRKISARKSKETSALKKGISKETPETQCGKLASETRHANHMKTQFLDADCKQSRVMKHSDSGRIAAVKRNVNVGSIRRQTRSVEFSLRKIDCSQSLRYENGTGAGSSKGHTIATKEVYSSVVRRLFLEDGIGKGSLLNSRKVSTDSCLNFADPMKPKSAIYLPDEDVGSGSAKCYYKKPLTAGKQFIDAQNMSDIKVSRRDCIFKVPIQQQTFDKAVKRPVIWKF